MAERLEVRGRFSGVVPIALFAMMQVGLFISDLPFAPKACWMIVLGLPIAACVRARRRGLTIDDAGLHEIGFFAVRDVRWTDVVRYHVTPIQQQPVVVTAGAAGVIASAALVLAHQLRSRTDHRDFATGRLVLYPSTGDPVVIDARYRDVSSVLDRVFAAVHASPRTRDYTPFSFSDTHLSHRELGTIRLDEIAKVTVDGKLTVHAHNTPRPWWSVSTAEPRNAVRLIEELVDRGVAVDVDGDVFLPQPLIKKLRLAQHARVPRAALPTATLLPARK